MDALTALVLLLIAIPVMVVILVALFKIHARIKEWEENFHYPYNPYIEEDE